MEVSQQYTNSNSGGVAASELAAEKEQRGTACWEICPSTETRINLLIELGTEEMR